MSTPKQLEAFCKEVLDPNKVMLVCGVHGYVGGAQRPPVASCKQCWLVYFVTLYAKTPPHQREETLETLEVITNHLAEDLQHDSKAFQLVGAPEFSIQSNVSDEEIQKMKSTSLEEV